MLNAKVIGDGPPLIILHGLFGSLDNWQTLARGFGASRTCHLLDLRNHGKSPHYDAHGYEEMAADVVAYLDGQSIDAAAVMGHSMGGKVAMRLALDSGRSDTAWEQAIQAAQAGADLVGVLPALEALAPPSVRMPAMPPARGPVWKPPTWDPRKRRPFARRHARRDGATARAISERGMVGRAHAADRGRAAEWRTGS